jgi:hypothetical protein
MDDITYPVGLLNDKSRITWKELKEFLATKDEDFLKRDVACFDNYMDDEVPVLGLMGDSLIVNS